jgi:hypothetical protein
MRIGSSTLNQSKPLSKKNTIKGLIPQKSKNFNPAILDTFNVLNAWNPTRGVWTTDGDTLTTATSSSSYPILTSFDLKSQNITSTMSLTSAGPGIVFWLQDENNWWAAVTYYDQEVESYVTGTYECNCRGTGTCWGCTGPGCPPGPTTNCVSSIKGVSCGCWGSTVCSTCYYFGSRTRYNFYVRLLKSINSTVSVEATILLRSTANASTQWSPATVSSADNINGLQITVLDDVITVKVRNDSNSLYGESISYTALNPNKGYESGVIFTPGSDYLENSSIQDISIVGA